MADPKSTGSDKEQKGTMGEGSYSGTRDYDEHLKRHIEKGNVEKEAREAKEALEGDEADELRSAEEKGKSRIAEEDPEIRRTPSR